MHIDNDNRHMHIDIDNVWEYCTVTTRPVMSDEVKIQSLGVLKLTIVISPLNTLKHIVLLTIWACRSSSDMNRLTAG